MDCSCPTGYHCNMSAGQVKCQPKCGDGICASFDPTGYDWKGNGFCYRDYLDLNLSRYNGSVLSCTKGIPAFVQLPRENEQTCCQDSNGHDDCACYCPEQTCMHIPGTSAQTPNVCKNCKEFMLVSASIGETVLRWMQDIDFTCLDRCHYYPNSYVIVTSPDEALTALEGYCSVCNGQLENLQLMAHGCPEAMDFVGDWLNADWLRDNYERLVNLRSCFPAGASVNIQSCHVGEPIMPDKPPVIPSILHDIWPHVNIFSSGGAAVTNAKTGVSYPKDYLCVIWGIHNQYNYYPPVCTRPPGM